MLVSQLLQRQNRIGGEAPYPTVSFHGRLLSFRGTLAVVQIQTSVVFVVVLDVLFLVGCHNSIQIRVRILVAVWA
jgi:hypothetical protein